MKTTFSKFFFKYSYVLFKYIVECFYFVFLHYRQIIYDTIKGHLYDNIKLTTTV